MELDDDYVARQINVRCLSANVARDLAAELLADSEVLEDVIHRACKDGIEEAVELLLENDQFVEHLEKLIRDGEWRLIKDGEWKLLMDYEVVADWLNENLYMLDAMLSMVHDYELLRLHDKTVLELKWRGLDGQ